MEQRLGEVHYVVVVRVRLIELHRGVLRIVLRVDVLVPEVLPELVDGLKVPHYASLVIELWRDPEVEVDVEEVVVRDEGTC